MTLMLPPICEACAHRFAQMGYACSAFPDGVPSEIVDDGFDHRQPFDGDQGIQFELAAGAEADLALYERSLKAAP